MTDIEEGEQAQSERRRWTVILIIAFWFFAIAMLSLRGLVIEHRSFDIYWPRRLATAILGAGLCLGMAQVLDLPRKLAARIAVGLTGALVMSVVVTLFSLTLNRVVFPVPYAEPINFRETVQWVLVWYGYFLAWTGTQLALTYHWQARAQQLRATVLDAARQRAEISALRYQLNPHFLFNALNSLACLVSEGRKEVAEEALVNMADFVRATLTSGPDGFVPLAEEVRLQQIYLAVEQTRFGDRLGLTIDLPPEVRSVQVPALILQPLVENAVRHGVSQSEDKVLIAISATEMDGIVRIIVSDDARSEGSSPTPGMGVGLANVRQRLKLQYGDKGELRTRQLPSGGFEATISLPVSVHG